MNTINNSDTLNKAIKAGQGETIEHLMPHDDRDLLIESRLWCDQQMTVYVTNGWMTVPAKATCMTWHESGRTLFLVIQ